MKKYKNKYYINFGLVLLILLVSSCYYDQVVPVEPELPDEPVSYSVGIQPFFDSKCVSCHNGGGIPLNLSPEVSYDALIDGNYVNINDPESSLLYTKINVGGSMEQYANATDRALTLKWIEEGATNE